MLKHQSNPQIQVDLFPEEENNALRQQQIILKNLLEKERLTYQTHYEEYKKTQSALEESQQHSKQLQRVIHFLRERLEEAQLESKQLKEDFLAAQETIASFTVDSENAKKNVEISNQQHSAAEEEIQALQLQFESLKDLLAKTSQEKSEILDKYLLLEQQVKNQPHLIEQLQAELTFLKREREHLEETLNITKNSLEEKEQNYKAAQHHLAKKMKETAILSDKNEEQRNQIAELQISLTDAQSKMNSFQNNLELQLQHERRLQEKALESLKIAENQVAKWEDKYFQLQEKFQSLEKHYIDLKVLEEKHHQAKALLNSLGVVMGASSPISALDRQKLQSEKIDYSQSSQAIENKQTPLFEMPEPFVRYKQTLFD